MITTHPWEFTARESLNVREAARYLNVHENTVRLWLGKGILPFHRFTSFRRVRYRDVMALQREREKELRNDGPDVTWLHGSLITAVKDEMRRRDWNEERLAREYGCTRPYIHNVLTGHHGPGTVRTWERLFDLLGITELAKGER